MINVELIKELREKTGAGVIDCKDALEDANGDMGKALEILKKKGLDIAKKKSARVAKDGVIASYIHHSNKIGVLVEVNCETDFVARNENFNNFVRDIAMQIAATNPKFIRIEDVPSDFIENLREEERQEFFKQNCLLEQLFIKDQNLTIKDYLTQLIAKIGENIIIRRFVRYQIGEE
ncbi:MAG: translation elongation factor Ts [Candidatus Omnitrophica bacterium]|nr:translation elongation factor Ts [Candidatus Omnitrophota bacterium]